jgi:tetratricopeptide (TPR) repeat protein
MRFKMLKRLIYLLAMLVLPLLSFGNDNAKSLFAQGNAYYAKSQYKEAINTYTQLINDGDASAAVYFNMGDASYKNGDIPSALLYYEKAHKLAPGDDDINFNLKYVNLKTTDKIEETPEFFLASWWRAVMLCFSTSALAAFSIVIALLASGLLVLYFFSNSVYLKRLSFYAAITLFFLGISCVFLAYMQDSYFDSHHQAIIFSDSVNVKNGPVDKSNTLFVIHDGTKVNILDNTNGWMKISLANGNEGWIKQSDVKEI